MAKKDETLAVIIAENERDPVLEERVQYYMSICPDLPKNTVKPVRTKPIDTKDPFERELWEREEIRRLREGHFNMSPKMYGWYNFARIWDIETGLIRPEFRFAQNEFFRHIEDQHATKEWGVISVKRRRVGASWMIAWDVLHDALTKPLFKCGMTSKTKEDAEELFKKVKFLYDNLPEFLQAELLSKTVSSLEFGYKEGKNKSGLQSEIKVKAPTDTSWEGSGLRKLVIDESGKISNLKSIFSLAEPVLNAGTRRVGTPILFGTAGDIGKEGKDFCEMWYNAEVYKLKQFFFGGWMGLIVDEYGNDLKEHAIRWIVYERKRKESLSGKEFTDFIQQYPLTVQEAFKSNEEGGLGNRIKIEKQRNFLRDNPMPFKHGSFRPDTSQNPVFYPDPRGVAIVYEEPEPQMKGLYIAGADPIDSFSENKNGSNISMWIMSKPNGLQPPKIVFEMTDRPVDPRDFYDQALLALMYYGNAKILIENNRYGMISYFEEKGFKYLLAGEPQGIKKYVPTVTQKPGYYKTKYTTAYGEEIIEEYIEDHCDIIPSLRLLDELDNYGIQNCDRVDSLMAVLMLLKDDKEKVRKVEEVKRHIPDFSYAYKNGRLVQVKGSPKPRRNPQFP